MKDEVKERLIKEYNELFERREKLYKFIDDIDKKDIDCDNSRSLLIAQMFAMDTYIQVLRLRFLEARIQWEDFHKTEEGEV